MYFNKDAFDEAGLDYPEAGWSWEDLLATAQALTQREVFEIHGFVFGDRLASPRCLELTNTRGKTQSQAQSLGFVNAGNDKLPVEALPPRN